MEFDSKGQDNLGALEPLESYASIESSTAEQKASWQAKGTWRKGRTWTSYSKKRLSAFYLFLLFGPIAIDKLASFTMP